MQSRTSIPIHLHTLPDSSALNEAIASGVTRFADDPAVRRTHFFAGRFENLYIGAEQVPEIGRVLAAAEARAREILSLPADVPLNCGGWINRMGPGHVTLPHRHDDDDELLSAVYYVRVPGDSGELVIHDPPIHSRVEPREGMFVFFPPDALHEVTENRSDRERISIGINIGPASRD